MRYNDQDILEIMSEQGVAGDDLADLLLVIEHCFQTRGSIVKTEAFIQLITEVQEEVGVLMRILAATDKLSLPQVKLLHSLVPRSQVAVTVRAPATLSLEAIQAKLEKEFAAVAIDQQEREDIGLQVSGNGRSYKRSLEKDVDVLLG